MGGLERAGAATVGSIRNVDIASYAETFSDGYRGGQCREFVNAVMAHFGFSTGGGAPNDYFIGFEKYGPVRVMNAGALVRGDVVQYRKSEYSPGLHTFIVRGRVSGSTYDVIDSNNNLNGTVLRHQIAVVLDDDHRAYRFGGPTPGDINGDFIVNSVEVSDLSYWWGRQWGSPNFPRTDYNRDNKVNSIDLSILSYDWTKMK